MGLRCLPISSGPTGEALDAHYHPGAYDLAEPVVLTYCTGTGSDSESDVSHTTYQCLG